MTEAPPARVQTRLAVRSDIDALVALMRAFYAESGHRLDSRWAAASFADLLGEPALGAAWIATVATGAVGHAVLTVRHAMEFGGLAGCIDDLYVLPAWRRRGVAAALLAAARSECERRGCKAWQVEVGRDNAAARALYRRCGLAPVEGDRVTLAAVLPPAS